MSPPPEVARGQMIIRKHKCGCLCQPQSKKPCNNDCGCLLQRQTKSSTKSSHKEFLGERQAQTLFSFLVIVLFSVYIDILCIRFLFLFCSFFSFSFFCCIILNIQYPKLIVVWVQPTLRKKYPAGDTNKPLLQAMASRSRCLGAHCKTLSTNKTKQKQNMGGGERL